MGTVDAPYVALSCAMSVDGYIDDAGPERLVLSNDSDLDRVDGERAASDAIMVGAGTVRQDDPRLLVRSPARRAERLRDGRPASPLRVVLTASGDLDPGLRLFTSAGAERLVYCPTTVEPGLRERLGPVAAVIAAGDPVTLATVLDDLARRRVRRLLVEGGTAVFTEFLSAGLADELHLAIAPFLVGDRRAPRFVGEAAFPHDAGHRMALLEARPIGDVVLLRYALTERARDRHWLLTAIDLSRRCPPAAGAFSVGAVLVDAAGGVIAEGWSRDTDPHVHAEESALARIPADDPRLPSATLYSSLEPCSVRRSRPLSCTRHILASGIRRVVFALREPDLFVRCRGAEELREAGVTVVEVPELGDQVRAVNEHLTI
ncbi:MAG TPA: dihydrofolate reductase family protein [Candidatus Dormibacteraeota bacterium]